MQVYANSNRLSLNTILFFIIVLIFAFLPVSTFQFFLKNDAFNGYFPPKFFMSESIHAGYLPLWNPYINFGIPQYGDMSSGYWSPVTWLVAGTVGYNAYSFTVELLFYIFLGGLGMFTLAGILKMDKRVCVIAGIAFMCCGYNVGHLQHFNWLSGAAFLPWCFWSYLKLLKKSTLKNAIVAALFFYLLVASAHPGITICAVYFFIGILVFNFFTNEPGVPLKTRIKQIAKANGIFLLLLLILSCGLIAGYIDILPYFVRGEKVSLADSLGEPANLQTWISAIFPFATVKNDNFYHTDISMRNSYFSLTLLVFFLLAVISKKNNWQKFLLLAGIIFALLSSGGIFKEFAYHFIPFIGYVRLNGEFRIFTLLCFIIIAAIELNRFIKQEQRFEGHIKWLFFILEIIVIVCVGYGTYKAFTGESIVFKMHQVSAQNGFALKLKTFIDSLSFYDTIWIQGIIQLLILWAIKWCLKCSNWNLLLKIVVIDLIIACLLNIPFSGVGKASVAQVQAVLNKSPKGIPVPALQSISKNDSLSAEEENLVGDWSMYNKQIGTRKEVFYPVALKNMELFYKRAILHPNESYLDQPFVFSTGTGASNIVIKSFSPTCIVVEATADSNAMIVLKQNFYPHWYAKSETEKNQAGNFAINFMSAPLIKGTNKISFSFEPICIKWAILLSLSALVLYCILLMILKTTPPDPS